MGAQPDSRHAASAPASEGRQKLVAAVRSAGEAAAGAVGGGVALVFEAAPAETSPRLRAAAGFASAAAARVAAQNVISWVRETIDAQEPRSFPADPGFGARGAGGLFVHPLVWEQTVHGALAIGAPAPPNDEQREAVQALVAQLGLLFEHAAVSDALAGLRGAIDHAKLGEDEKNEEILKLSEALFAQDIELLRNNEKLGKIEKLKSDFIERMSRELRTPLNAIIESIIAVLTGENDRLSDAGKQTLRSALDDGTSFLRTLQNILDLWRVKQGELPIEIQDVNFRETVDEAIFSVQDAIGNRDLAIELDIAEQFPKIRTDLTKINQILFLLIDNGVKFTPSGKVRIAARVEDEQLLCQISDTGIGICPDDQQYVFDEFFQVDAAAGGAFGGAGLGLALVRDLLLLLDGEISVESEVGKGSTFSLSLPVQVLG